MEKNGTESVAARSSVASGENRNGQSSSDIIKELYEMPLEELQELARKEREEAEREQRVTSEPILVTSETSVAGTSTEQKSEKRNLTRREFLGLGAAAFATATGMALSKTLGETPSDGQNDGREEVDPDDLGGSTGEIEKYSTLREVFSHIDNERFDEDRGRVLNDPETVGGHAWAWDAGESAANTRMRYWVAYKNDLQENPEFTERYDKIFNGLQTADDYGAFFEHIAYTTRPVAAAELIALKHPEFAGSSLEQVESGLEKITDNDPERALVYKKWLEQNYAQGKTEYKFVDIPDAIFNNMGIEDRDAKHGIFSVCDDSELLRDEKNQLVAATTVLSDGTSVTRYINPVCINILSTVRVNGKPHGLSVDKPMEEVPDNPSVPEHHPDNPPKDNPPDEPQPEPEPEPQPEPESKNYENMERIDEEAHEEIADDVGTEEITVSRTESSEVESQPITSEPSAESYEGTGPSIVESEPSYDAEPVTYSSPQNDYTQDLGVTNSGYAPVQPDTSAPLVEDSAPPATVEDAADILSDLGIN